MNEPTTIIIGDTVSWTHSDTTYPATAGWVLSYTLINSDNKITINTAASGADHVVTVAAATTAAWVAGAYKWVARMSRNTGTEEVHTIGQGSVTLQDNFAALTNFDVRSHAVKTLSAIEATLEGRANSATAEYQIAGRAMKYIPIPELLKLRDKYRAEVASETAAANVAAGLPRAGRVYVRMGA